MDHAQISKVISHALRHAPAEYGLSVDQEGFVELSDMIDALKAKGWNVSAEDLVAMVGSAQKKRHEIVGSKIRAYYGHTIDENISRQAETPPDILYHGTVKGSLDQIFQKGLLPMQRNYVHLSSRIEEARLVAGRRRDEIAILTISAKDAFNDGIAFFPEQNNIWLAGEIPAKYIRICEEG